MKKKVAIFTAPEGHLSISEAISESLSKKYKIDIFFQRDPAFSLYVPIYQLIPQAPRILFKISKNKPSVKIVNQIFEKNYYDLIKKFIENKSPDLCISTHWLYHPSLSTICSKKKIPYLNAISDPRSIHPFCTAKSPCTNLVFDQLAINHCKKNSPNKDYQEIGWFVRNTYEKKYQIQEVRKKLNLDEQKFTVLVVSGSEGTSAILKILPALFAKSKPFNMIIACGNNTVLRKSISALIPIVKQQNPTLNLTSLPFTKNLHKYMQAADLIVGKAGPNTLFESVATLTPFFAITHISGQENGNLDIIRDYNLGYVEENPFKAAKLLIEIINHPEQLMQFQKPLKKLADYNLQAKTKLLKLIAKLLTNS